MKQIKTQISFQVRFCLLKIEINFSFLIVLDLRLSDMGLQTCFAWGHHIRSWAALCWRSRSHGASSRGWCLQPCASVWNDLPTSSEYGSMFTICSLISSNCAEASTVHIYWSSTFLLQASLSWQGSMSSFSQKRDGGG